VIPRRSAGFSSASAEAETPHKPAAVDSETCRSTFTVSKWYGRFSGATKPYSCGALAMLTAARNRGTYCDVSLGR